MATRKKKLKARQRAAVTKPTPLPAPRIVQGPHKALKQVAETCTTYAEGKEVADKLMRALLQTSNGVGLAANQIAVLKRVCVINTDAVRRKVLINPVIVEHSEQTKEAVEGCLSYPLVMREVTRYMWVEVEHLEKAGLTRTLFRGFSARVVQHEIDHLNGICRVQ